MSKKIYCSKCGSPTPHLHYGYFCSECARDFSNKSEQEQEIELEFIN